jgi:hypothetical protein
MDLPPPLEYWKGLYNYPYKEGFIAAADKEFSTLESRGTFYIV